VLKRPAICRPFVFCTTVIIFRFAIVSEMVLFFPENKTIDINTFFKPLGMVQYDLNYVKKA